MTIWRFLFLALYSFSIATAAQPLRPVDEANERIAGIRQLNRSDKIVGGNLAAPGKYPFQVALITSKTPPGKELLGQFCGGALIGSTFVLTAAHCVAKTRAKEVDVFIGSTVLPNGTPLNDPAEHPLRKSLSSIVVHQKYNSKNQDNDIALLALVDATPADFTPVATATPQSASALAAVGQPVTVVGWGAEQEGGFGVPKLKELTVQVQDSDTCARNYQAAAHQFPSAGSVAVTGNMFCAGRPEGGADSCQADSGGFLGAQDQQGHWVQLGIVSWGLGCARPGLFGVYTRVANYTPWIEAAKTIH